MSELKEEFDYVQTQFNSELRLGLDEKDEIHRHTFEIMIYWLSKIYMRADWKKIARSKNVYRENVFEHAIKAASAQPNIRRLNDKLCAELGLQSLMVAPNTLDLLETHKKVVLKALRVEAIYFSLKAIELGEHLYKNKKWSKI